jgi:hypothetical protein
MYMLIARLFTLRVQLLVVGALLLGTTLSFAQVNVSLPAVNAQLGQALSLPITVGTLPTGSGAVFSYQFTVTYDKSIMTITGTNISGTLTPGTASLVVNNDAANGKIQVSLASAVALSGTGTLINLVGTVSAAGTSAVTFSSFFFNEGNPAAVITNGSVTVPSIALRLPTSTVRAGSTLSLGVLSDNLAGKGVKSYTFWVSYDKTIIQITGVSTTNSITPSTYTVVPNADPTNGVIKISAAGATDLTGAGNLIYLTGTVVKAGTSSLTISNLLFNEGTPDVGGVNGSVTVTANTKPTLAAVAAKSIKEQEALQFTVSATDPENDALTYSASGLPTGATFSTSTRAFSWTPAIGQNGSYSVKFFASDGLLSDSTTVSITVAKILYVANAISSLTLPDGSRLNKQKLTAVFGGNKGTLTFTAASSDTARVQVSILTGDTLQVRGRRATTTAATVTVTATDIDASQLSTSFLVTVTGTTAVTGSDVVPTEFVLAQNYPNPFNPSTTIGFSLPKQAPVTLEIYNVLGVKVRTLIVGRLMNATYHSVVWDSKDDVGVSVPSGVYLYRISADQFLSAKRMMLLK